MAGDPWPVAGVAGGRDRWPVTGGRGRWPAWPVAGAGGRRQKMTIVLFVHTCDAVLLNMHIHTHTLYLTKFTIDDS